MCERTGLYQPNLPSLATCLPVPSKIVTEIIEIMKSHFGDLVVHCGSKNNFLGIEIIITKEKQVNIEIKDQLMEAVTLLELYNDTKVNKTVTSFARKYLRLINEDCTKLSGKKCELVYSIVAKLRYHEESHS